MPTTETIIDNIADAVFIIDQEHRVIFANNQIKNYFGKTPGETINKYCYNVFTSDLCFKNCPFDLVVETGTSITKFGVKIMDDTGEMKEVCYAVSPYVNEGVKGMIVTIRDASIPAKIIEELKNEQNAIPYSKGYFKAIMDETDDGIMLVDRNLRVIDFNRNAELLTGFSKQELYGQHCPNITSFSKDYACPFDYCAKNRQYHEEFHTTITRKDGAPLIARLKIRLMQDEKGAVNGGIGIIKQIVDDFAINKSEQGFMGMIGTSKAMRKVYEFIQATASSESPVLITGENGTGKQLVAATIHAMKNPADAPLITVNCSSVSDDQLENELFGFEKGAFVGAVNTRLGKLEQAAGGTLVLTNISEASGKLQEKLLHVIKTHEFERVGGTKPIQLKTRIIATTSANLHEKVKNHAFREDLFYRLNTFHLTLPPLRERPEDIAIIAKYYLKEFRKAYDGKVNKQLSDISLEAQALMAQYPWHGNVRELRNCMENLFFVLPGDRTTISASDLPPHIRMQAVADARTKTISSEKDKIISALKETNFDRTKAAKNLGVSRVTLWRKMNQLNITIEELLK